ncbi:ribonuclease E activity regulator RraA [Bacillus solitudinis]|uniref:ribonuclease E activity regulator RraA n=1 Tax=Bacillus solitudinis TaxID=2014074 RepID=UPI000C239EC3|nr:ribonuclease E activity regulator RraA [Bacillus solitudinis]
MSFYTSELCDKHQDEIYVAERSLFEYFGNSKAFSGPIVTIKVYEDNGLVENIIDTAEKGSVIIIHGSGSRRCALLGKQLTEKAVEREIAGIIVYGCIRDSHQINQMDIGIIAIGTNPIMSVKEGAGEKDIPVHFAGIDWIPGQYTYADQDGIIIAKRKLV